MDGIVDSLPLSVGDLVKSGDVVGGLINLNPLRVVAQVSERDVTRLTVGAKAQAVLPDGRVRFGELRYISKKGNDTTRTFRIDVWVENADGSVPQGLTAELRLPAETEEAHLVSPAVLTLNDSGVIGIKAVDDANKVIFYPVRIIADTPSGIWLGGLPETVTMITVGQEFVKVGATVRTSAGSSPSTGSATEAPKG
jgi:multidrug efflux system membrane fusion protein